MADIVIILEDDEKEFSFEDLDVTFDSSPDEILEAVSKPVLEQFGVNIKEDDEFIYTVKKIDRLKNVRIFPKSPAGIAS